VNRARRDQGAPAAREVVYEDTSLPDPSSLRRSCSRRSSPSLRSLPRLTHLAKGFTCCAKNPTNAPSSSPSCASSSFGVLACGSYTEGLHQALQSLETASTRAAVSPNSVRRAYREGGAAVSTVLILRGPPAGVIEKAATTTTTTTARGANRQTPRRRGAASVPPTPAVRRIG
jgi:hypothetical protein